MLFPKQGLMPPGYFKPVESKLVVRASALTSGDHADEALEEHRTEKEEHEREELEENKVDGEH